LLPPSRMARISSSNSFPGSSHSVQPKQILVLILILAAAGYVRFFGIGQQSLWMDELWSIEIATSRGHSHDQLPANVIRTDQVALTTVSGAPPWWKIWSGGSDYSYPPLYNLLLRIWLELFGNSAAAGRCLSALVSLASVFILFDLCRLIYNPRIGLLTAGLMAFAPAQIDLAQEMRCYALLILFALCAADVLVRIEKFGANLHRFALLGLALSAAFLTHYLFAGLAAMLGVYALIRLRGKNRRGAIAAFIGALLLILIVWGYPFYWQWSHFPGGTPGFLQEAKSSEHGKLTYLRVAGLPGEFIAGEARAEKIFRMQSAGDPVLTFLLLFSAAFTLLLPIARLPWRRDLLLWILWIFGTLWWVTAFDLLRGTTLANYPRYTILAAPAIYAIIASFNWPNRPILRDAAAICVLVFVLAFSIDRLKNPPEPKQDWRQLISQLNATAGPNDLLVFYNNDRWESPGFWYMGLKYYAPDSNRPWLLLTGPPAPEVMNQLQNRQTFWLIGLDPARAAADLFPDANCGEEIQTTAGAFCRVALVPAYNGDNEIKRPPQ
jgi:4-amino-4-deoxy-L-arabinose transferase-like glycosyltransferase